MSNKIIYRKYYALDVKLDSPLSISNGEEYYTDSDVLRNGQGELFVPGTSLAGAFRNYLGSNKKERSIYGYSDGNNGEMSSIFISDLYFDNVSKVSVRDGVRLNEGKTVDNKFDMEIIETGTAGTFYINYIVREKNENIEVYEAAICNLFQAIQNGTIRFGANKNRGFGRMKIENIYWKEFDIKSDVNEFLKFRSEHKNKLLYKHMSYGEWVKDKQRPEEKHVFVKIPLKLKGGVSIRRYSTEPMKADFEHIVCNKKPIIPGTSWNGAIRSACCKLLNELGSQNYKKIIEEWFGDVYTKNGKKIAKQSIVIIGESIIEKAVALPMTRNKINRFDASTTEGALYSEIAYFGGETTLEIMVKKDDNKSYQALLGILYLVIEDIQKGYLAIGGQTAIGRGIFEADTEKEISYSEDVSIEDCLAELYTLLQ